MTDVKLYTKSYCPYSRRAKELLQMKGVHFEDVDVTHERAKEREMVSVAGGKTSVPQIFIGGRHIGGCDDLEALEERGELDALLNPEAQPSA